MQNPGFSLPTALSLIMPEVMVLDIRIWLWLVNNNIHLCVIAKVASPAESDRLSLTAG